MYKAFSSANLNQQNFLDNANNVIFFMTNTTIGATDAVARSL